MIQKAIELTADNIDRVAETVDYYTAEDLLAECAYMLNNGLRVVLGVDMLDGTKPMFSYVVSLSVFYSNNPNATGLNTETYIQL